MLIDQEIIIHINITFKSDIHLSEDRFSMEHLFLIFTLFFFHFVYLTIYSTKMCYIYDFILVLIPVLFHLRKQENENDI